MADAPVPAVAAVPRTLVLVLPDGSRVPISHALTIGRGEAASVRLADQTVSRTHARISVGPAGPLLEDTGSRFGTQLEGARVSRPELLRAGSEIRVGDVRLTVESDAPPAPLAEELEPGAGETFVMPVGATEMGLRSP